MKIRQLRLAVIASAAMGLMIICLSILVINQQLTSSQLSTQIVQERHKASRLSSENTENTDLAKKYSDLSAKFGGRYREVTWSKHIPFMVNQLTGIMQAHELKIETLRPNPIRSVDNISQLPLRIGFKAELADLAGVVQDVEKTTPVLNIESLDIRTADDKSGLLQTDMTVSSYAITDKDAPEVDAVAISHPIPVKIVKKQPTADNPRVSLRQSGGAR